MADLEAPPKAGTKTDSDAQPAADSAPGTTKDDLRATAGKAPVTTQDVGDDVKVVSATAAEAKRGKFDLPKQVDASREVPAVTKVVVEADDDETRLTARLRPRVRRAGHEPRLHQKLRDNDAQGKRF